MTTKETVINVTLDLVFSRLLERQRNIQTVHMGGNPAEMSPGVLANYIRTQTLALVAEAVEVLDETHWKPWATPPAGAPVVVDKTRFVSEMADVHIFFMNMMLAGGVTMHDLAEAVDKKQTKNILRQVNGYDGKSEKCPGCKRAYDDEGVSCTPSTGGVLGVTSWCEDKGYIDTNGVKA